MGQQHDRCHCVRGSGQFHDYRRQYPERGRSLPNGTQITVTPITTDEVQTITFTGNPTSGTFTLDFAGSVTGDITFAGVGQASTTAQNIQDAWRSAPEHRQ